jgi:hypothetical protein
MQMMHEMQLDHDPDIAPIGIIIKSPHLTPKDKSPHLAE